MQTSSFGNAKDSGKPYQRHVDVHVSISVVVNKWKDENDKFMTSRQWLDFCRVENSTSEGYPGTWEHNRSRFFPFLHFFYRVKTRFSN
ncbi:hypothetical protein C5167_036718 [Papaver somniferum]|uniref:Uncharacterized protein n=1 Tax=Papaver somniferum TaxID=3469 RepID=A0A4Y7I7V6_PAPSO|nr:hypothetical protein C5167_036718 [Papaver somniferum]